MIVAKSKSNHTSLTEVGSISYPWASLGLLTIFVFPHEMTEPLAKFSTGFLICAGIFSCLYLSIVDPLLQIAVPYFKSTQRSLHSLRNLHIKNSIALIFGAFVLWDITFIVTAAIQMFTAVVITIGPFFIFTPLREIMMCFVMSDHTTTEYSQKTTNNLNSFKDLTIYQPSNLYLRPLSTKISSNVPAKIMSTDPLPKEKQEFMQLNDEESPMMDVQVLTKLTRLLADVPMTRTGKPFRRVIKVSTPSKPEKNQLQIKPKGSNAQQFFDLIFTPQPPTVRPTEDTSSEVENSNRETKLIQTSSAISEVRVAPPGDLFLSEKVTMLSQELQELTNEERSINALLTEKRHGGETDEEWENANKTMSSLTTRIRQVHDQKVQYEDQAAENTISPLLTTVEILAWIIKTKGSLQFAAYNIMIQRNTHDDRPKDGWIVTRRYSEFLKLHENLCESFPDVREYEFPAHSKVANLSRKFLESRRARLECYLQLLIRNPDICKCELFLKFLCKEV